MIWNIFLDSDSFQSEILCKRVRYKRSQLYVYVIYHLREVRICFLCFLPKDDINDMYPD